MFWCCLLFDDVGSIEFKHLGPLKWIKHHPTLLGHHVECIQMGLAILPRPKKDHHHHLVSLLSTFWKSM